MDNPSDKKNDFLDAFLADMPITPSKDFTERVLADCEIDNLFREMPLEAPHDFAEKTILAANVSRKKTEIAFPRRLAAIAASLVVATASVFIIKDEITQSRALVLSSRIEQTLQNDPELSALADGETLSPSFDEWLAASEILSTIDPNVLEIFACND